MQLLIHVVFSIKPCEGIQKSHWESFLQNAHNIPLIGRNSTIYGVLFESERRSVVLVRSE